MASTFTSLQFHIVFGTKCREPFLTPGVRERVHQYLGGCFRKLDVIPMQIGGVDDHIHALIRAKPVHAIADLLRQVKKGSSEWLHRELPEFHWQDGYSAFTVSKSQVANVTRYIAGQEEHHRVRTFEEEYRDLLRAHEIEFDERYLL